MESIGADLSHPLRLLTSTSPKSGHASSSKEDDRCSQISTTPSIAFSSTHQYSQVSLGFISPEESFVPTDRSKYSFECSEASDLSTFSSSSLAKPESHMQLSHRADVHQTVMPSRKERFVCGMTKVAHDASNANLAPIASEASVACEMALEAGVTVAEKLNISTAAVMIGGAVGYGILGFAETAIGGFQIHQGLKDHDKEGIAEGISNTLGGISNTSAAATFVGVGATGVRGAIGSVAGRLVAPLAIASGAIDTGLGIKELSAGIKEKSIHKVASGALATAFGVAVVVSALGGGVPALIAAGTLWIAQRGVDLITSHHQPHSS